MDSLPCFLLKKRIPGVKWVASWYQTAPNPLSGYEKGRYRLSASLYYLAQLPVKPLISRYADFVFVNNEIERGQFGRLNRVGRVFVFMGAVPIDDIKKFLTTNYKLLTTKKYDAVFQGRFHPQKGVVELVDIWKKVVDQKPDAKLAMIGDGPLRKEVESRIRNYGLGKNIKLFGFVFDGDKKYKIFAQSKVVVHPAFYDSGGMASAEAMAFGLPCVGFDLPAYQSYYPKGMVKVKLGGTQSFAGEILRFVNDNKLSQEIGSQAKDMVYKDWSWNRRVSQTLEFLNV